MAHLGGHSNCLVGQRQFSTEGHFPNNVRRCDDTFFQVFGGRKFRRVRRLFF